MKLLKQIAAMKPMLYKHGVACIVAGVPAKATKTLREVNIGGGKIHILALSDCVA